MQIERSSVKLRVSPNQKTFFYEQQKQNERDDFSKKEENMVIISIRTPSSEINAQN